VDAVVAETEANVGVGAAKDAPKRELADELAAAPVLENIEGADAACEVAKEKPLAGVDEAAGALLENEKAEAEGADENREDVVLPDDGAKPNEGAEAVVAGDNEKPRDGAVVAGDEAAVVPNRGAGEVDPNKVEPVAAPNPRAGVEAEVAAVLDAAGALLKPNDGVGAVVAPDADEPKPKPGVDAAEETAPNRLGVVAAAVVAPKIPGVVAGVDAAPKRLGVLAADEVAGAPKRPGVVAADEVADAPKMLGVVAADEVAGAPKMLGVVVVVPNMVGVVAAAEVAATPKRGEADEEGG
jgi:hypothetical protein